MRRRLLPPPYIQQCKQTPLIIGDNFNSISEIGNQQFLISSSVQQTIMIHMDRFDAEAATYFPGNDSHVHLYLTDGPNTIDLVQYGKDSDETLWLFEKRFQVLPVGNHDLSNYIFYYNNGMVSVFDLNTNRVVKTISGISSWGSCFTTNAVIKAKGFNRMPLIGFTVEMTDWMP